MRIALKQEKNILHVLEKSNFKCLCYDVKEEVRNEHHDDNEQTVFFYISQYITRTSKVTRELFDKVSRTEKYETSKELFHCKMIEGSLVNTHVLKMIGYIEKLRQWGFVMDYELNVNLVL